MALEITAAPNPTAVAKLAGRTPIASILRSAEWAEMPLALRERAQLSAGIESVKFLQTVQDKLLKVIQLQREQVAHGVAFVNRDSFIADLRQVARSEGIGGPGAPHTSDLTDIQSSARLGLIYDMQTQQARNYASWKIGQDTNVLDAFPAQELIRVEARRVPRNWQSRWQEAGGNLIGDRMIALKTDPIWENISTFGTPWPPFDWGSGMGLRDVSRQEAITLGLLDPAELIEPQDTPFNDSLAASVENLAPDFINALKKFFGNQLEFTGDTARWKTSVRSDGSV